MTLEQLDPFVRFAARMGYEQAYNGKIVRVTDCRLFYILEGSGQLHIGGRRYDLIPDSLFYCCAGSQYVVRTKKGFSLISLNFDLTGQWRGESAPFSPEWNEAKWEAMAVHETPVENSGFLNDHLYLENAAELRPLAWGAVEEFAGGDPYARLLCGAQLKLLLLRLHRLERPQLPSKIALVRDYIQNHYAEPLTNKSLAAMVGYHEYYLNRLFTACTGTSLHAYLMKVRLSRADYLILNTDMELQRIGEQVGFRSYPHFSSCFKQAYGYSPAEYRKRLKGSI